MHMKGTTAFGKVEQCACDALVLQAQAARDLAPGGTLHDLCCRDAGVDSEPGGCLGGGFGGWWQRAPGRDHCKQAPACVATDWQSGRPHQAAATPAGCMASSCTQAPLCSTTGTLPTTGSTLQRHHSSTTEKQADCGMHITFVQVWRHTFVPIGTRSDNPSRFCHPCCFAQVPSD